MISKREQPSFWESKALNKRRGFTLIEIMIVIAIVSILVAIGLPSYKNSINRARHSDALIALEKAGAMQEQHFFHANQYSTDVNDLGGVGGALLSPEGNYSISSASVSTTLDYTLTATATSTGAKTDEDCYFFRLSNTGAKTAHKKSDSAYATNQTNCIRN